MAHNYQPTTKYIIYKDIRDKCETSAAKIAQQKTHYCKTTPQKASLIRDGTSYFFLHPETEYIFKWDLIETVFIDLIFKDTIIAI